MLIHRNRTHFKKIVQFGVPYVFFNKSLLYISLKSRTHYFMLHILFWLNVKFNIQLFLHTDTCIRQ